MIRRFDELHLRILLEQQAEIGELENKLNQYDDNETTQLYLSSYRADKNQKRRDLIAELKIKLQEYGLHPQIVVYLETQWNVLIG